MSSAVYNSIKSTGKLPSPSGVALELMHLVADPATTIDQVCRVVEADPAIASKLLKLVNSPLAGTSRTVGSIQMAVRLLGLNTVRNVSLGLSLLSNNRNGQSLVFDFERFWSESLARAVAARNLAEHFACCPSDEAFTIGLLSRMGRLALATTHASEYDLVLNQHRNEPAISIAQWERNAFGIDQNELTAEMLADWHLADLYCQAVLHQDDARLELPQDKSRVARVAGLLHLSDAVALIVASKPAYQEEMVALTRTAERLGLSCAQFIRPFDLLIQEWPQVASIFCVASRTAPSLREMHMRASRRHCNILVVDNDAAARNLHARYLTEAGYTVRTAASGEEAFQTILAEGFQLVVTGLNLPEMDGFQLCRAVRESEAAGFVYFIVVTSLSDDQSMDLAFEAGANDFLVKPCRKEELLSRLKAGARAVESESRIAIQQRAVYQANAELATANQALQEIATTDELTGLYNRREAMRRLEELWDSGDRYGQPLACMMIDIDHFKSVNDTLGHDIGDLALRATAQVLKKSTRKAEAVFRLSGEEFLVVCPDATTPMACIGAERIRAAIADNEIPHAHGTLKLTASIGVASRTPETHNPDNLLKAADQALYEAKQTGRNRVCVAHAVHEQAPSCPDDPTVDLHQTPAAAVLPDPANRETVLLIDPDDASRSLFRTLLQRDGFEVAEAADGHQALATAAQVIPDVIVLDVDLPGLDAIECTRRLKADPTLAACPLIVVSSHSDSRQIEQALQAGADEFVAKPLRHSEFVLRVRSMTRLHHGRVELLQSNAIRGEQARAMTILFDLSQSLTSASAMDDIVVPIITATAELMNCRRVSLMLPDAGCNGLNIVGSVGIPDETGATLRFPMDSPIAGQVFTTGQSIICNSMSDISRWTSQDKPGFFASAPLASHVLAIPDKVVGVLNVTDRYDPRPFAPHEIEYLDLICNMGASALEQFHSNQARERAHSAIVIGLARLAEHRDSDTGKHLERVTQYALLLADELRKSSRYARVIDANFLQHLERAMPLHDIGKVAVPDAILLKPGALTDDEQVQMQRHAVVGAHAIKSVIEEAPDVGFLRMAHDIAHHHHEWFDGTGYPAGLAGEQIPLPARIAAVADVYDALRSKRPYKNAFPHTMAIEIIRDTTGTHFDTVVVDAFLSRETEFAALAESLADEDDPPAPSRQPETPTRVATANC